VGGVLKSQLCDITTLSTAMNVSLNFCEHNEALFAKKLKLFLSEWPCRKQSFVISDRFYSFFEVLHAFRNWPLHTFAKLSKILVI